MTAFMGRRLAVAAAAAGIAACSATVKPSAGLMVILSVDHLAAPADYDTVRVQISQETTPGQYGIAFTQDYRAPSQAHLPTTVAIDPGTSLDQNVLVRVIAFSNATPVVLREVQVGVPTDRVAELRMVLSRMCLGKLVATAGSITPACAPGKSCQPDTGACDANAIAASKLPDYTPGDEAPRPGVESGDAAAALDGEAARDGAPAKARDAGADAR